jgi:hypothetical protein
MEEKEYKNEKWEKFLYYVDTVGFRLFAAIGFAAIAFLLYIMIKLALKQSGG